MAAGLAVSVLIVLTGYFAVKPYQVAPRADPVLAGIGQTLSESIDGSQAHLEEIQRVLSVPAVDPEILDLEQRVFEPLPGEQNPTVDF